MIARAIKSQDHSTSSSAVPPANKLSAFKEVAFITTTALRILFTEPIVTFLGIYNGWAYGLVFLFLDGVYPVFVTNNGLDPLAAAETFLNFVPGVSLLFLVMPLQTVLFARDRARREGVGRPEARLLVGLVLVWLYPVSIFWFAFTSDGSVSFWSPLVAGGVLAFVNPLLYLSMLNYIVDAYPHVAASAVAAFLVPSFLGAAVFAHVGIIMFENLTTTTAFEILAFVSFGIVALVYVLYFCGPRLRRLSKLARRF